jgi:PAS domain S-box-containing protein
MRGHRSSPSSLEFELTENKRAIHSSADGSPSAIVVVDHDDAIVGVNRSVEPLFGYAQTDLTGRSVLTLLADRSHSQWEQCRAAAIHECALPPESGNFWFACRADGSEFPAFLQIVPLQFGSQPLLIASFLDATPLWSVEEAISGSPEISLRNIAELDHSYRSAPVGLCLVDSELKFAYVNERMAAINGVPVDAHFGRTLRDVLPDLADQLEPVYREVLQCRQPRLSCDVHGVTSAQPDIERHWVHSHYPVVGKDGTIIGVNTVVQDVSELRSAQEQHQLRLAEIAHVARVNTLGAMAAALAHEINQPLHAIVTYVHGCLQRLDTTPLNPDDLKQGLKAIESEVRRAARIVRGIRRLSEKNQVQHGPVDINEIVLGVRELTAYMTREAGVTVSLNLEPQLPPVRVDAVQVEQVVLNLVWNAKEAMCASELDRRELIISTMREQNQVVVVVADTGPGVAAADRTRIFDAFYTTKDDGLGMGLAICSSIIRAHGGRLWMEDGRADQGEKTRFCFALPIAND